MNPTKLLAGMSFIMCSAAYASTITPVAPCLPGTLANYIALGATGCSVGPTTLVFSDFSFGLVSASGGAVPIGAADIAVTPVISAQKFGLNYASSGFKVTAGQFIQYLLSYTIDDPPIIHGFELDMFDPPTPPGMASITNVGCLGAAFSGSTCPTSTITQMVSDNGITASLTDIKTFGPVTILGDRSTITLDAHLGGTADITSFTELAIIPEPATAWCAGAGLLLLFSVRRRGGHLPLE
jgi:hypothetical protein